MVRIFSIILHMIILDHMLFNRLITVKWQLYIISMKHEQQLHITNMSIESNDLYLMASID
jgi:hypothetical protein